MKIKRFILLLFLFNLLLVDTKTYAIERYFYLYDEIEKQAVMDNTKSEFVTSENGIDFSHISSLTNGKGVYIDSNNANNLIPYNNTIHLPKTIKK